MTSAVCRIGVSGWRYAPWRGVFYPPGLPQHAELGFIGSAFSTVEINGSFYSLQRPESWRRWYCSVPRDFQFAVKGPRYVTHMLRLRQVELPLANFFASGIFELREKLGPILWQFPARFPLDLERFAQFLALLPQDSSAAEKLASRHSAFMRGRVSLESGENRPLRHAFEVRHPSFNDPKFAELLQRHDCALVVAEGAGQWPMWLDVTAEFVYLRLHGDSALYRAGYGPKALERWRKRIACYARGSVPTDGERIRPAARPPRRPRDVYCYFDNTDVKLRAPFDARALMHMLKIER
jgi:uncharacterized protein YecE (DUF72 family)